MNFLRLVKSPSSTRYPLAEATCATQYWYLSSEIYTLRTEFTEYELRAYLQRRNNWSDEVYDSISWPAYRSASTKLSDSERTFVVKLTHGWLPIGARKTMQWYDRQMSTMQRNRDGSPPVPPVQSTVAQPVRNTPHGHLKDTKTAADLRRTIIQGIESWFITGDTNDPTAASPKSVGFKSLGYIPEDWTSMQEGFYRKEDSERIYTGKQWTKELIEFF
jgi:hypothetical protein